MLKQPVPVPSRTEMNVEPTASVCKCSPRRLRRSGDTKNPALNLSHLALADIQTRIQVSCERTIAISLAHPRRNCIRIVLVAATILACERPAPKRWVHLHDRRVSGRNMPAVEWPEVKRALDPPPEKKQPLQASVRGLRHGAVDVETEDRLSGSGSDFRATPPTRFAGTR